MQWGITATQAVTLWLMLAAASSRTANEAPLPHEVTFSNLGGLETSASTFYVVLKIDVAQALTTVGAGATLVQYYKDL